QRVDLRGIAATDLGHALLHVRVVDARRRDRGAHPVQDDDTQGEQDLPPQVDCPERRDESRKHSSSCAAEPLVAACERGWSDQRLGLVLCGAPSGSQPAESRLKQSTRLTVEVLPPRIRLRATASKLAVRIGAYSRRQVVTLPK